MNSLFREKMGLWLDMAGSITNDIFFNDREIDVLRVVFGKRYVFFDDTQLVF
jgi:hypothetical protein